MRYLLAVLWALVAGPAWCQLYPFPNPPASPSVLVTGPISAIPGHLAYYLTVTPQGISLGDAGTSASLGIPGVAVGTCAIHKFANAYSVLGNALSCQQPAFADLSDTATFSIATTGSVSARSIASTGNITASTGNITGAAFVSAGSTAGVAIADRTLSTLWRWYVDKNRAILNNGSSDIFWIDSGGIPSAPTVQNGIQANNIGLIGISNFILFTPPGAHQNVQEWLQFKNAAGVTRYVPAF